MSRSRHLLYQRAGAGMLRAAVNISAPALPAWPGPGSPAQLWRSWLAPVWADEVFQQAVSSASPDLARQVGTILDGQSLDARRSRRAALAVARYAIRYAHRSTPFGLFAGVSQIGFGGTAAVRIGDGHEVCIRPDPVALDAAIRRREADLTRMADVEVRVSNLARLHDGLVYVPSEGASQFSLALTPAVALVLEAARSPIRHGELAGKLAAEFLQAGQQHLAGFLGDLLRTGLLRSALRAAATVTDPATALSPAVADAAEHELTSAEVRLDAEVRLPLRRSLSRSRPRRRRSPAWRPTRPGLPHGSATRSGSPTGSVRAPRSAWNSSPTLIAVWACLTGSTRYPSRPGR